MELFDPQTVITRYGLSPYENTPLERTFDWIAETMAWAQDHYPDASPLARAVFAALVPGFTTGLFGGYGTETDPLHEAAEAFVLALAGGMPPAPGGIVTWVPLTSSPLSPQETTHLLDLLEVFLFVSPDVALTRALQECDRLPADEATARREALLRVRALLSPRS